MPSLLVCPSCFPDLVLLMPRQPLYPFPIQHTPPPCLQPGLVPPCSYAQIPFYAAIRVCGGSSSKKWSTSSKRASYHSFPSAEASRQVVVSILFVHPYRRLSFPLPWLDLSSLSYIAGMLIGNPAIRVWLLAPPVPPSFPAHLNVPTPRFPISIESSSLASASGVATPATESGGVSPVSPSTPASSLPDVDFTKHDFIPQSAFSFSPFSTTYTAPKALALTNTSPLPLASKEHLGILNGTAFSAGLAALVVSGAGDVVVLSAVGALNDGRVWSSAHSFIGPDRVVRRSHARISWLF